MSVYFARIVIHRLRHIRIEIKVRGDILVEFDITKERVIKFAAVSQIVDCRSCKAD